MFNEIQIAILKALRFSLFGGTKLKLNMQIECNALANEAIAQAVFPFVFSVYRDDIEKKMDPKEFQKLDELYFQSIISNVRVQAEHSELHEIMQEAGIPYVIMKGCASAAYYPEIELRSMGDVDFLVYEEDIPRGIKALEQNGFHRDQYEFTTNQSAYLRPPMTTWEIHKNPSGIPKGPEGTLIRSEFLDIIETAQLYELDGEVFYVPDKYHHGLILLLHKISHMTTTGIGLRHLCDWAVFEKSFSNEEFTQLFEQKLKKMGIWKFAQMMTLVCEKYLGAPRREWAHNLAVNSQQIKDIMEDILSGGNFGHKDDNRQREIKYLTDRKAERFGEKNIYAQALASLNQKVYTNHTTIKKHKFLLPAGWIIEGGKYLGTLTFGKRKSKGTSSMLKEVAKRKEIYRQMKLFKVEE